MKSKICVLGDKCPINSLNIIDKKGADINKKFNYLQFGKDRLL